MQVDLAVLDISKAFDIVFHPRPKHCFYEIKWISIGRSPPSWRTGIRSWNIFIWNWRYCWIRTEIHKQLKRVVHFCAYLCIIRGIRSYFYRTLKLILEFHMTPQSFCSSSLLNVLPQQVIPSPNFTRLSNVDILSLHIGHVGWLPSKFIPMYVV